MGLFGSLISLGMDIVTTPIAVVKDAVTLGGAITDEPSAIGEKMKQIEEDWENIKEETK